MITMQVVKKKQQRTIGAIIQIPLEDGYHTYGRILQGASFAFYDLRTKEEITDLHKIIKSPVLFITAAYDDVITSDRWIKIGKLPLEEKFAILPPRFIQDTFNKDKFRIVYANRTEKEATINECKGLERFMVWEGKSLEERLSDYYAGRKNRTVEEILNPETWRSDSKNSNRKIA